MIRPLFVAALCAAAWGCSSTAFTMVEGDGGGEEHTGVLEALVDGGSVEAADGGVEAEAAEVDAEAAVDGGVDAAIDADAEVDAGGDVEEEHDGGGDVGPIRSSGCSSDSECVDGDWCRWGVCTHICEAPGDCPPNTLCSFSSSGADLCFPACDDDLDCIETMSCVDGVCLDARDIP